MQTAIVTILIFLVLISLHEFGHFIFAKMSGVSVLEFSVGMGPAIFKKQYKETLYSIRIFPVGGYCKLESELEKSDDPKAFTNQKLWKRFLVISAGAILNLILGFLLIVIMTATQPKNDEGKNLITTPVIDSVIENSYLSQTDVQSGDKIVEINGHSINFYNDITLYSDEIQSDEEISLTVKRDGEKYQFNLKPSLREVTYDYKEDRVIISSFINSIEDSVTEVYYTDEDYEIVKEYIGKTAKDTSNIIGFSPKTEEVGINNIFSYSFDYTIFVVRMVYKSLVDLITGDAGIDQLSGPVGIVSAVNTAVNTGSYKFVNILFLTALLSINLGIFNLLPIPALDGGRLLFLLIELIIRKPVPPEKEGMIHAIGMILLLAFAVFVTFNDVLKLFN